MKIIFTGGHHNSALAVARELKRQRPEVKLLWLGHKHTRLGEKVLSAEYKEVTGAGIEFSEINAGKVYQLVHDLDLRQAVYTVKGIIQALNYVLRFKPNLIVSFGGYLAAPVVLAGWILRIPSVTHEQTTVVGWSNRFIARLARKVFITWPASEKYFPSEKVVWTGLPLREAIFKVKPGLFRFDNSLPTLYFTGGKQGSHVINQAVLSALDKLLLKVNLIHQVGGTSLTDDFAQAQAARDALPNELKARYVIKEYFFEDQIGAAYHVADLVISRAGAHTIYELAALGKPSLLIPMPWASHNEQFKNARILVNQGIARILPEERLNPDSLIDEISRMLLELKIYQSRAKEVKSLVNYSAAKQIVSEILKVAS